MNKDYTVEEFANVIEEIICEEFAGRGVKVSPVRQLVCRQNQTLHAIAFRFEAGLAPVFYIERMYECLNSHPGNADETIREIANGFVDSCINGNDAFSFDEITSLFSNFEAIRGSVFPRVCSVELNSEFLSDKPHFLFADNLSCFFVVKLQLKGGDSGSITVTNNIMDQLQVTAETLKEVALYNLEKEGYFFDNLMDVLFGMIGAEGRELLPNNDLHMLYLMSNMTRTFGASVIADSSLMKEAFRKIGEPFYVLPSSIHEVLLLPKSDVEDPKELLETVSQVNDAEVPVYERLAYHVYLMDDLESFKVRCVL